MKTLVWNGPFGTSNSSVRHRHGRVAEAVAETHGRRKLCIGRGGQATRLAAAQRGGLTGALPYVSTAGGAFLGGSRAGPAVVVEVLRAK